MAHSVIRTCGIISYVTIKQRHPKSLVRASLSHQICICRITRKRRRVNFNGTLRAQGNCGHSNNEDELLMPNAKDDWRLFRAKLVSQEQSLVHGYIGKSSLSQIASSWAHQISSPERGCLLVAREDDMAMFTKSVVLILENNRRGSSGLILNRPSPLKLRQANFEKCKSGFGENGIYIGGPVKMNNLQILHCHKEIEGARKIIEGVYYGGFVDAEQRVLNGEFPPTDFKLFAGHSAWQPYQLAEELGNSIWHVMSTSKDIILDNNTRKGSHDYCSQFWEMLLSIGNIKDIQ